MCVKNLGDYDSDSWLHSVIVDREVVVYLRCDC